MTSAGAGWRRCWSRSSSSPVPELTRAELLWEKRASCDYGGFRTGFGAFDLQLKVLLSPFCLRWASEDAEILLSSFCWVRVLFEESKAVLLLVLLLLLVGVMAGAVASSSLNCLERVEKGKVKLMWLYRTFEFQVLGRQAEAMRSHKKPATYLGSTVHLQPPRRPPFGQRRGLMVVLVQWRRRRTTVLSQQYCTFGGGRRSYVGRCGSSCRRFR